MLTHESEASLKANGPTRWEGDFYPNTKGNSLERFILPPLFDPVLPRGTTICGSSLQDMVVTHFPRGENFFFAQ
jgi:hypothetical protein